MRVIFILSMAVFLITGCTEIRYASHLVKSSIPQQQGTFKIGNPYKIGGKYYYPKESYDLVETGIASWYGPNFHGKLTANGERYDMNELTAAHRTLQMPSIVRVTNLDNGRSLILRVNDRGPYSRGRVLDVSKRGAELLGFKNKGTTKVRIEVLKDESLRVAEVAKRGESTKGYEVALNKNPPPRKPISDTIPGHLDQGNFYPDPVVETVPVPPTNIYVQAGSFSQYDNALKLQQALDSYAKSEIYPTMVNGQQFYRVRLGPVMDVVKADEILASLSNSGNTSAMIVVD